MFGSPETVLDQFQTNWLGKGNSGLFKRRNTSFFNGKLYRNCGNILRTIKSFAISTKVILCMIVQGHVFYSENPCLTFWILFTVFIIFKETWIEALSKVSYSKFWIYWVRVNTMTIEQWGFFSVFICSWHSLVAECLADKVSQPVLKMYVFCTQDSNTQPSTCGANATHCLLLYS